MLVLGATLVYLNSFRGAFQFDDITILADSRLENPASFVSHLGGMIRPALKLSFLGDRLLWGGNPAGYHVLNLLLHLGSGLLVHALVLRLGSEAPARRAAASSTAVPFWTALLFLIHPISTETVTYISGRATGLMAFLYLAGLLLYLRATRTQPRRTSSWAYCGAIACFMGALLSKETAVTFPLALLLVEVIARGSRGTHLRDTYLRFQLPFWGILLLWLAAAAFHPRYPDLFAISVGIRPVYENLLTQVNATAWAVSLFFAPWHLNFEHDIPVATSILTWRTSGALLLLLGMLGSAVVLVRRNPLAALGIFWFFLQLLPTNSILPRYDVLSERNLYLAAPGLFIALVSLWSAGVVRFCGLPRASRWARFSTRLLRLLPLAIIPCLAVMTIGRNALYADPVAFWTDAVEKSPAKARPHLNLGYAYYVAGDLDRAIAEYRIALAIDRDDPVAQANLLSTWFRKHQTTLHLR